jgi:hypothetical protein
LNAFSAFLFAGREDSQFSREINSAYPLNPLIPTKFTWDTTEWSYLNSGGSAAVMREKAVPFPVVG